MKRNLFTIVLIAFSAQVFSQMTATPKVLSHVGDDALFFVSKSALVYNGGGLQVKDAGVLENHGNIMIVAGDAVNDVVRTLNGTGDKTEGSTVGGTIINKLNEPTAYANPNPNNSLATPTYTYGQLYIQGINQDNIKAIVDQEYRAPNHGGYQQFAVPFFGKTASTLSAELGKTFNTTRWSQNEILVWNHTTSVFNNLPNISTPLGSAALVPYSYYILGGAGLNVASVTRTLKGTPVSDVSYFSMELKDAGKDINYGPGGNAVNQYNEKYNSYLGDPFYTGTAWDANYGKNAYFVSNPYLVNLDLKNLNTVGDINLINNLQGIRLEPTLVQYNPATGGSIASFKYVTVAVDVLDNPVLTGDTDYLMIRPMGTFKIRLKDNTASPAPVLNLANLRRFNYYSRDAGTTYHVTANRGESGDSVGTVKELTVIGLNSQGNEIARTYYVVYPNGITGHSINVRTQVTNGSTNLLGTFEEDPINGGYDNNYTGAYWLYINEANEYNFKGKNVKLVKYTGDIVSYKIQIKENGELINNNQHLLSSGIGFYYRDAFGALKTLSQGEIVAANGNATQDYDLYYGEPGFVLGTGTNNVPSRTVVLYNPNISNYIVRFDPSWNQAEVQVYDMTGKLVISQKNIKTTMDYIINLSDGLRNAYVVKVVSDKGELVQTKIIK